MNGYRAVKRGVTRTVIEKSVFLTYAEPIASEEEAVAFLQNLREKHRDATHVCYGFVADAAGTVHRFSDDGEPSGTAGMPILEVIKANGLRCSLIAVVRWFGGIKLGAGGLTRAYAGCAGNAVRDCGVTEYRALHKYTVTVEFAAANKIKKISPQLLCKTGEIEYNDTVRMTLYGEETLPKAIVEATAGRAVIEDGGVCFVCLDD